MKKSMKRVVAFVMTVAMVVTIGGFSNLATASAASKKKNPKLSKSALTLYVKASKKVTIKNKPKKATVKWTTSNKKVATVKNGKITAKKAGKATIKATLKYKLKGKKKTKTLKVKVTVKKKKTTKPATKPTVKPTATPVPTPYTIKSNDTSNIGEEREVTIVGGTSEKMKIKDNGTMRKELSSQDLIKDEMGIGINLGNTLEATKAFDEKDNFSEATDYEQAWSSPITTQEYVDAVHSYGFNTLRVPVAWTSMVKENDTTYTINEKMLGRVEEVVNYALNNGMYVIINDHYDYGWWGKFGACTVNTSGEKVADETTRAEALKRYKRYWEQITERFKDYSDHLIFESANEEFGTSVGGANKGFNTAVNGVEGNLTDDEAYELTNKLNQEFVNIVRKSGGNNEVRHLLLAGFNTNIEKTVSEKFVMPTDTEENGKTKMSVSVHYYSPWDFCGDGMTGNYEAEDRANTVKEFDSLSRFTKEGYGVMIGECGVCNPKQEKVGDCLLDLMQISGERGLLPIFWDTPGTYFNRKKNLMQYRDLAELMNRVTGANGNTADIKAVTGLPNAKITPVDLAETDTPVWSWEGQWAKNNASNIGLDGNTVTSTDMSKFVQTTSCTDITKITFNDWGYQTFLHLDWSKIESPCIKVTFKEDTEDKVGTLVLATMAEPNGSSTDEQKFKYDEWKQKAVIIPETMIDSLNGTDNPVLQLTFGNAPIVTGIYVYDKAQ